MSLRRAAALSCLLVGVVLLSANLPASLGQMCCTPCSILNLSLTIPTLVQAGKPFTLVSTMTVWCDFLSKIRVDLVGATSYQLLSTSSLLLRYSPSGSYIVSLTDNAVARNIPGSWSLLVEAYVIDPVSGYSMGSWSQLFQITVLP